MFGSILQASMHIVAIRLSIFIKTACKNTSWLQYASSTCWENLY